MAHIDQISANIFGPKILEVSFTRGLNILSGENGTGKSRILQKLREGAGQWVDRNPEGNRIQAISPRRNMERRTMDRIAREFQQQGKGLPQVLAESMGRGFTDQGLVPYPSFADAFYLSFADRCKDGGDQLAHMNALEREFNNVVSQIFEGYRLAVDWNREIGVPNLLISKRGQRIGITDLSLGEQEILSLVMYVHTSKNAFDVCVIDEPEVHLNWHLEQRLFEFFDQFCTNEEKQLIVATHSRAVFLPRFLSKTQFLGWNENNELACSRELPTQQLQRLTGEAINIIHLGDFTHPVFFVEDNRHDSALHALAAHFNSQISVSICGNRPNVESLLRLSKAEGRWQNSYFIVDSDGMGNPFPNEPDYLQFPGYCVESCFLDADVLAEITAQSPQVVREKFRESLVAKSNEILKKNKYLDFLLAQLSASDLSAARMAQLDGKVILDLVYDSLGIAFATSLTRYIDAAARQGRLEILFSPAIVAAVRSGVPNA